MKYGQRKFGGSTLEVGVAKALPVEMRSGIVEISSIYTPPAWRRMGHANALMSQVTVEADLDGKILLLAVGDGEEGAASKQDLLTWYERHGFAPIQAEPLLLARPHIGMRTAGVGFSQSLRAGVSQPNPD